MSLCQKVKYIKGSLEEVESEVNDFMKKHTDHSIHDQFKTSIQSLESDVTFLVTIDYWFRP